MLTSYRQDTSEGDDVFTIYGPLLCPLVEADRIFGPEIYIHFI